MRQVGLGHGSRVEDLLSSLVDVEAPGGSRNVDALVFQSDDENVH